MRGESGLRNEIEVPRIEVPVIKKVYRKEQIKINRNYRFEEKPLTNKKLFIIASGYIFVFLLVSAFKMSTVFALTSANKKLNELKEENHRLEVNLDNLRYSYDSRADLNDIEILAKSTGFVEDQQINYIKVN